MILLMLAIALLVPPREADAQERARTPIGEIPISRQAPEPAPAPPSAYDLAARRYGVSAVMLRALHFVESSGSMGGCVRNQQGTGALGPFQFMPRTFWAYAVDADGDGVPNICSFADSLFTAARYLKAMGADTSLHSQGTNRALLRYGTDPALVIRRAR